MKTRHWRRVMPWHSRFLAAITVMAMVALGAHPASAQDDKDGVDGNIYLGPNFGWSVEWDEDIWEVRTDDNSGGSDFLSLITVTDDDIPFAYVQLYGVEGRYDDPDECASGWEDSIADRDGVSDLEATDEFDLPRAPRGSARAAYAYIFEDEDNNETDGVEYVQCRFLEEDGALLIVTLYSSTRDFEAAVPLFEDITAAIELPEEDSSGGIESTGADSGIDDAPNTSPTYGVAVEWDEDVWTVDEDAELVDDGRVGLDRLRLDHLDGEDLSGVFSVEAKTAYDGDPADCVEGEFDILGSGDDVIDYDPFEDRPGDPIEGETDGGGEFATFIATVDDGDGGEFELVEYVECRPLEGDESVLIFTLLTSEVNYDDELDLAQGVIDMLELEDNARANDDEADEPTEEAEDEDAAVAHPTVSEPVAGTRR